MILILLTSCKTPSVCINYKNEYRQARISSVHRGAVEAKMQMSMSNFCIISYLVDEDEVSEALFLRLPGHKLEKIWVVILERADVAVKPPADPSCGTHHGRVSTDDEIPSIFCDLKRRSDKNPYTNRKFNQRCHSHQIRVCRILL